MTSPRAGQSPSPNYSRTAGYGFQFVNGSADRLRDLGFLPRFAMLIVCPSCAISYEVEPNTLSQDGRSVRCASCRHVWVPAILTTVSGLAGSDEWDGINIAPGEPSLDSQPDVASEAAPAEFAAPEDIDVVALSSEIETMRAEPDAQSDAVFAEDALDDPAGYPPPLVPSHAAAITARHDRARRGGLRGMRWPRSSLPAAILVLLAVNAGLVAWRQNIVLLLPQTAAVYAAVGLPVNLRGLAFDNIRMSRAEQEGVDVLMVEGTIVNVAGRPVEVPRLRLALHNGAKREVYAWTTETGRSILAPGDALPFKSRLASPPRDAREVQVRFFNPRDVVAGLN